MKRGTLAIVASAISALIVGALVAYAAPSGNIWNSLAVCDPNSPTHCAAPDSTGALPVTAATGSLQDVNLKQVNGGTAATGSGAMNAQTLRTALATDSPGIITTGTDGTPASQVLSVQPPSGETISYATMAASTNSTSVKASAGVLYHISVFNNSANIAYLKFYNKASAPTCNSDTVVFKVLIPGNASGAGAVVNMGDRGLALSTGIAYCVTGLIADNDNTSVAASAYIVNLGYK